MKQKLLLATKNQHKQHEMAVLLGSTFEVLSLLDFPDIGDIEETGSTFEANARLKAQTLFDITGAATIADDSGLSVNALEGQPGIYSARFAGINATDENNRKLLLSNMEHTLDRKAFFTCCIVYISSDTLKVFNGELHGSIAFGERGANGFGYDSVFIPEGSNRTLGEMDADEKNQISHRSKAVQQLIGWLAEKQ